METKLCELNMLPLTTKLIEYIHGLEPLFNDLDMFDYVVFYKQKPFFYTHSYINDNSLEFLKEEFDKIKDL